ncbi:hypothetical protein VTO42DRAFT_6874 [Malbranchea cinnamomea]
MASGARCALELFQSLYANDNGDVSSVGYMAFDAHVGDTSCQLRASMLMMLRNHLLKGDSARAFDTNISRVIQKLDDFIKIARTTCRKLTRKGESLEKVGLAKSGESRQTLLEKLGWIEPPGGTEKHRPHEELKVSACHRYPTEVRLVSPVYIQGPGNVKDNSVVTKETTSGSPESWNPASFPQAIRLIVFSYVLSKYKRFCRRSHIVRAELNPKLPLPVRDRLISEEYDLMNRNFLLMAGPKRFEQDIASMQNWLGELSSSRLKELASRFGTDGRLRKDEDHHI